MVYTPTAKRKKGIMIEDLAVELGLACIISCGLPFVLVVALIWVVELITGPRSK